MIFLRNHVIRSVTPSGVCHSTRNPTKSRATRFDKVGKPTPVRSKKLKFLGRDKKPPHSVGLTTARFLSQGATLTRSVPKSLSLERCFPALQLLFGRDRFCNLVAVLQSIMQVQNPQKTYQNTELSPV